jgi:hypothetical protein
MTTTIEPSRSAVVEVPGIATRSARGSPRERSPRYRILVAALLSALGMFVISVAYWVGPYGAWWKQPLYFTGQLLIFLPSAAWLLASHTMTRRQRLLLVVVVILAQTAGKYLYSPYEFKFGDELQHWRTATDIQQTHHLFRANFSLPVSPSYPGLESVTSALSSMTGLSVFAAGLLLIGVLRAMLALSLFLLFEHAWLSFGSRVAGIATLLYTTNAHFQFFDAMYVYETMALPCAVLVLAIASSRWTGRGPPRATWWLLAGATTATVIVTHHVTSWLLAALLAFWAVTALGRSPRRRALRPAGLALIAVLGIELWITQVARGTYSYVAPVFKDLAAGLSHPFVRSAASTTVASPAQPPIEHITTILAAVLVCIGVAVGVVTVRKHYQGAPLAWALSLASLSFFAVLTIRVLAARGGEISGRLLPFVFVPVAFVLAITATQAWWLRLGRWRRPVLVGLFVVLLMGGLVSGWPPFWERIPGPYRVVAFEQSIEPQGVSAARWAGQWLRPRLPVNRRIAADFVNGGLMSSYADLNVAHDVSGLYYARSVGRQERSFLRANGIRYVVIDLRMARQLPVLGFYFRGDTQSGRHRRPLPAAELWKFQSLPGSSRVFDSGDVIIFDLKGALNAS